VKLVIDFIDGPRNDRVKIYVDGTLRVPEPRGRITSGGARVGGGTGTTANDQSRTVD
jgi:hypothetical protein